MRYYLIAGEASGDLHGSNLIKALKQLDPQASFRFWGGDLMAEASGEQPVRHIKQLAFMGFAEVIMNLRTIAGLMRHCKEDVARHRPDVLILIDYPGFNMRMAAFAQSQQLKVAYYISPQVWAWKKGRARKLKATVDRMITILPFEADFYLQYNWPVAYVGHPLLDALNQRPQPDAAQRRARWGLDPQKPIVALLPGSRAQEISTLLPIMLEAASHFPECEIVVAGAPSQDPAFYNSIMAQHRAKLVLNQTYDLLEVAHAAWVTSGTATLETALLNVPQVVCYKGNPVSYAIARQIVDIPYISLVNLIAAAPVVEELIQGQCTPRQLRNSMQSILAGPGRTAMLDEYARLRQLLGGPGASQRAATEIYQLIHP
jgi:lipid-A-disaccharide synthase